MYGLGSFPRIVKMAYLSKEMFSFALGISVMYYIIIIYQWWCTARRGRGCCYDDARRNWNHLVFFEAPHDTHECMNNWGVHDVCFAIENSSSSARRLQHRVMQLSLLVTSSKGTVKQGTFLWENSGSVSAISLSSDLLEKSLLKKTLCSCGNIDYWNNQVKKYYMHNI